MSSQGIADASTLLSLPAELSLITDNIPTELDRLLNSVQSTIANDITIILHGITCVDEFDLYLFSFTLEKTLEQYESNTNDIFTYVDPIRTTPATCDDDSGLNTLIDVNVHGLTRTGDDEFREAAVDAIISISHELKEWLRLFVVPTFSNLSEIEATLNRPSRTPSLFNSNLPSIFATTSPRTTKEPSRTPSSLRNDSYNLSSKQPTMNALTNNPSIQFEENTWFLPSSSESNNKTRESLVPSSKIRGKSENILNGHLHFVLCRANIY